MTPPVSTRVVRVAVLVGAIAAVSGVRVRAAEPAADSGRTIALLERMATLVRS
jgi:hypothetical protein